MIGDFVSFVRHCRQALRVAHGVLVGLLLLLVLCAAVFTVAEDMAFGDALYLALITGLTIGYGDIAPATLWGRIAAVLSGVIGMIYIGIVVAVATRALAHTVEERSRQKTD